MSPQCLGATATVMGLVLAVPAIADEPPCDTTFHGAISSDWTLADNWTNGLPTRSSVACVSADSAAAWGWENTTDASPLEQGGIEGGSKGPVIRILPSLPESTGHVAGTYQLYPDPPHPLTMGACCLGSACLVTDYVECRESGGNFNEGVVFCTGSTCANGACCDAEALCEDDGGLMDEATCDILGGNYLGGASCAETDPCMRFRIPEGFEIIEVSPFNGGEHGPPEINDCGEIAFNAKFDVSTWASSEIFFYDNGRLSQLTINLDRDVLPRINDKNLVLWHRGIGEEGVTQLVKYEDGAESTYFVSPLGWQTPVATWNNFGHIVHELRLSDSCPPRDDLFFANEFSAFAISMDDDSNQSARVNDRDQIVWERTQFGCPPTVDWTSDILLMRDGDIEVVPTALAQRQGPETNVRREVVTDGVLPGTEIIVVEFWDGENEPLVLTSVMSGSPDINDIKEIVYTARSVTPPAASLQTWLLRDDVYSLISFDVDHANVGQALNNDGEIAWWWHTWLSPSGIRYMRRIRNGDVNFDGVVDRLDAARFPGCITGSVPTDRLCECRFFDIDHDRDVDDADVALFVRLYDGAFDDCNGNGLADLDELIAGTAEDCDLNGLIDSCDETAGTLADTDADGMYDTCCTAHAPVAPVNYTASNRYLSISMDPYALRAEDIVAGGDVAEAGKHTWKINQTDYAMRVTFVDLPAPFDVLNGTQLWAGVPEATSQNGGSVGPVEGFNDFHAAPLVCDPVYFDFGGMTSVHLYHEAIVPDGVYEVQAVKAGCGIDTDLNFSAPLSIITPGWGDAVGVFLNGSWHGPDESVDVASDVVAALDRFASLDSSPAKVRVDLEPSIPDRKINITDITWMIEAFAGGGYPFPTPDAPCP